MTTKALRTPLSLRLLAAGFLAVWVIVAMFPLVWTAVMSFRAPVDALSSDPWAVLTGPATRRAGQGLTLVDLVAGLAGLALILLGRRYGARGWIAALAACAVLFWLAPMLDGALRLPPIFGLTLTHYRAVWIDHEFYRNFLNSLIITAGVVTVSLTVGTLAGYGLARTRSLVAFWILITALIFRALPHSVLVTGYVPFFLASRDLLMPLWNAPILGPLLHLFSAVPPTFYGQPWAVIIVLVSINQPFTIWMMRSFFDSIPTELDEAARVDGCTHLGAFLRVIMPVMWPGVVTTGLFAFLLAYNDYLVTALLLDAQSQTMVPAISQFLNSDTKASDQIEAIAAAVSITAPLFLLVTVFQRQIVSGLTAGAVKG
jgi:multiple sugar transport system permease protein